MPIRVSLKTRSGYAFRNLMLHIRYPRCEAVRFPCRGLFVHGSQDLMGACTCSMRSSQRDTLLRLSPPIGENVAPAGT